MKPVSLSMSAGTAGRLQSGSVVHLFFESNVKMPWRSIGKISVTFTFSLSGNVDLIVFVFDFIIWLTEMKKSIIFSFIKRMTFPYLYNN